MSGRVIRLIVAAALFLGWMSWLGYAALSKSRGPVVSRAQAAVATHPVVAEVAGAETPAGTATVIEPLGPDGPLAGTDLKVANLPEAAGWGAPGRYLLLLAKDPVSGTFYLVGQQRSPGFDLAGVGAPTIYPWSDDVRAQAKRLWP